MKQPPLSTRFLVVALPAVALFLAPRLALALTCNSTGSGTWNAAARWSCGRVPTTADSVTILNGHTVTVNANTNNVTSITVNTGGTLTITTFNVLSAGGISVSGTINRTGAGTITATGGLTFNSGGVYIHAQNGGTIPTATWNVASTVRVTGVTNLVPGGLGQSFGNLTWNSVQTGPIALNGALTTVRGNFTVLQTTATGSSCSTGYRSLILGNGAGALTVGGDFLGSGLSSINLNRGAGTYVVNIGGNFNYTGGFLMSQNTAGGATPTTVNFTGAAKTFNQATTGGGGTGGSWLDFTCGITVASSVSFVVNSGASLTLNSDLPIFGSNSVTVQNGGRLDTGTHFISNATKATGTFTLASGGTLGIGDPNGITSSGATGNIQTGTRSFSTGGNYVYNAAGAQSTGNGLPATVNNLQIAGSGTKTLTASEPVNGTLTLTAGTLAVGTNTLTANGAVTCGAGTTITSAASGTVVYRASAAQNVCAGSYGNLTTGGSGTKTQAGNVTVAAALTVGSGTSYSLSGTSTLSVTGLTTVSGGFVDTSTGTLTLTGGLVNNGTFQVDGAGSGCNAAGAQVTVTGGGTWSGSGAFQLTDVVLNGMSTSEPGKISAFHASGSGTGFNMKADCTSAPTAIRLASFTATVYDRKVLLRWRTAQEVDNLGFRIYRQGADSSAQVTPALVSGSGLLAGAGTHLSAGRSYSWWDESASASTDARYWLEDVDMRGKRTFHGPISPRASKDPPPAQQPTALLDSLTSPPVLSPSSGLSSAGQFSGSATASATRVSSQAMESQWRLAAHPALKIGIQAEGWYRITQADLAAHGFGTADPRSLQLYADGQPIPIEVTGTDRYRLTTNSAIEFYATGLDSQWSGERVYWLAQHGTPAKRIATVTGSSGAVEASSFPRTVESRPRQIYFPGLINGMPDKFFGPLISPAPHAPATLSLTVSNTDANAPATLTVTLQGVTDGPHQVAVTLNGQAVGEVNFSGQNAGTVTIALPGPWVLREGQNDIGLVGQGGDLDYSLLDSVSLTYGHTYTAEGNRLKMTAVGGGSLSVRGFTSSSIRVVDVTDPSLVLEVQISVSSDGGSYLAQLNVPGSGQRTLLAFTAETIATPASLTTNVASTWHATSNAANLIIITHPSLRDALVPLQQLRESQGRKVALVSVDDVYDEFSFGNKTPQALRDFLAASLAWKKRPAFVLLVGSASADSRNYLGRGKPDLVPTRLVEATYSETASDDWFADFNDDGLPELAVGRLPARDASEAAAMVSKLVGYGHSGTTGWQSTALLVAGAPGDDQFDFEAASSEVAATLPATLVLEQIFTTDFASDGLAHDAVIAGFKQGALLVNYIGHGSETSWQDDILTTADAAALDNGLRLPFVSDMTCWNGWIADPYGDALGEVLLKAPQGGALAVWASSGLTEPADQLVMDKELMRQLLATKRPTIGEAVMRAKAATGNMDVRRTWILLGDPTAKLP